MAESRVARTADTWGCYGAGFQGRTARLEKKRENTKQINRLSKTTYLRNTGRQYWQFLLKWCILLHPFNTKCIKEGRLSRSLSLWQYIFYYTKETVWIDSFLLGVTLFLPPSEWICLGYQMQEDQGLGTRIVRCHVHAKRFGKEGGGTTTSFI